MTRSLEKENTMSYEEKIEKIRAGNSHWFTRSDDSPLSSEERRNSKGLQYFPVDPKYRIHTRIDEYKEKQTIQIATSTGEIKDYIVHGKIDFEIDSMIYSLNVYQNMEGKHYFIPFRDKTSGISTYGAGRYLDFQIHGDKMIMDFNLSYNMTCAYSDNYSCTLVPLENYLAVEIKAGEKKYR